MWVTFYLLLSGRYMRILILVFCCIPVLIFAQADFIFYNGKIFTSDRKKLWVNALAIKGQIIVQTGSDKQILSLKQPQTKLINLDGKTVVPGFNDAHNHIGPNYPSYQVKIANHLEDPTSWSQIEDSLRRLTKRLPAGKLIVVTINPQLLDDARIRRGLIDSAAPFHPVILKAWTGHGKILNTAALKLTGISRSTTFLGGWVEKDAAGEPTGLLMEYAGFGLSLKLNEKLSSQKIISDLKESYKKFASEGITTVQTMSEALPAIWSQQIYSFNEFGIRVRLIPFSLTGNGEINFREWKGKFGRKNSLNSISGLKIILDATPVERWAAVREPYSDQESNYGRLNFTIPVLKEFIQFALDNNQQIIVHAVGDSAMQTLMNTMLIMHPASWWKDKRVRIEHGDMLFEDLQDLAKEMGLVFVLNPTHFSIPAIMNQRLNIERFQQVQPMKSLLLKRIPFAFGSDGSENPFLNLMFAIIHPTNPKEAISIDEAVIAYTYGSAYAEFAENEKGTLSKGKLADLLVLSQDIFEIPPKQLPATTPLLTMVGGKIIFNVINKIGQKAF